MAAGALPYWRIRPDGLHRVNLTHRPKEKVYARRSLCRAGVQSIEKVCDIGEIDVAIDKSLADTAH